MKASWDEPLEYCPGGCGYLHRRCCDSVIGQPHQSICRVLGPFPEDPAPAAPWWLRILTAMAVWFNRL